MLFSQVIKFLHTLQLQNSKIYNIMLQNNKFLFHLFPSHPVPSFEASSLTSLLTYMQSLLSMGSVLIHLIAKTYL